MPDLEQLYQDPYERQVMNQYYGDPRNRRESPSLGSTLLGFAQNMAVFVAVSGGLKLFGRMASVGASKLLKTTAIQSLKNKKFLGKDLRSIVSGLGKVTEQNQRDILSNWSSSVRAYDSWKASWAAKRKLLKTAKYGPSAYKQVTKISDRYSKFYRSKLSDFWFSGNVNERVTGKVLRGAYSTLSTSAAFYGTSKILGTYPDRSGSPSPSWYDVPAHIADFTRFTAGFAPSLIAFQSLGGILGLTREFAAPTIAKASQQLGLSTFAPQALAKVAKVIPPIRGLIRGTGSYYNTLKENVGELFPLPGGIFSSAKTNFKKTYENYLKTSAVSTTHDLEYVMTQIDVVKDLVPFGKQRMMNSWIRKYRSKPYPSFIERMLDLRSPALSKHDIARLIEPYGDKDRDFWKRSLESLTNKGVPLYDKGVYTKGKSTEGLIDLRNIRPQKVFKDMMNFVNEHLKIGRAIPVLGPMRILPLFGIDRLLSHKPIIKAINYKEKVPIGLGGKGVGTGIGEFGTTISGDAATGAFFDNRYWSTYKDLAGRTHLSPIVGPREKFLYMVGGRNNVERNIMENWVKINSLGNKTTEEHARHLGPIGKAIVKAGKIFDIQPFKRGGPIGYIKAIVQKYYRDDSPYKLMDLTKEVVKPNTDQPTRDAFYHSLRSVIQRGNSHASRVFMNPKVLERFGVDATISEPELYKVIKGRISDIDDILGTAPGGQSQGARLLKNFEVKELMRQVDGDSSFQAWGNVVRRAGGNVEVTGKQNLLEFLAADNLVRRGVLGEKFSAIERLSEGLLRSGSINDTQRATLNIWLQRFKLEEMFASKGYKIDQDLVNTVSDIVRVNSKDYETVVEKLFKPLTAWYRGADIRKGLTLMDDSLLESFPYSGFTSIPYGDTKAKFLRPGESFHTPITKETMEGVGLPNVIFSAAANRLNRLFDFMGLGMDMSKYKSGSAFLMKGLLLKRVLPIAGTLSAYDYADKLVDINPMFDGTIFDEGIGVAAADLAVKARMMVAQANDFLGITSAAKYAEGLMPGFIDSTFMRAMRGAVVPIVAGAKIGGHFGGQYGAARGLLMGAGLGATQGFGMFDLTKSREELEEIYSGREEVPIRRGRWWMLSSNNFQGGRIHYFRPNWYARLKSKYKTSPDGLGAPVEQMLHKPLPLIDASINDLSVLGQIFDPHHYAYRHYYSQPYADTGTMFEETPFVGPTLASTVGRLIKPSHLMHQQELEASLGVSPGGYNPTYRNTPGGGMAGGGPRSMFEPGTVRMNKKFPVSSSDITQAFDEQLYRVTEAAGLWGFGAETMIEKMFGFQQPFQGQNVMANASEITSFRRAYWDLNLGDPIGACFVKGTKVETTTGRKNIEDIIKGDKIISLDGKAHSVIDTLKKRANDLYKIKVSTVNTELIGTSKHHIPIFKRERCVDSSYRNSKPCIPNMKKHCSICTKKCKNINIINTNLKDIKLGDYCVVPILPLNNINPVIDNIEIDSDLAYVLGWFIAEGYTEKTGRVSFTMHKNEEIYAKKISDIIYDKFGKKCTIRYRDNVLILRVQCMQLTKLCRSNFGKNAKEKHIPYIFKTLPKRVLFEIFTGLQLGDGFSNPKKSGFHSASSSLVQDLYDIGLSLGFRGNLVLDYFSKGKGMVPQGTPRKDSISSYIQWDAPSSVKIYNLLYNENLPILKEKRNESFVYDNKLFVPVTKLEKLNVNEVDVYDLYVKDLHFYKAGQIVVSNTELWRRFIPRQRKHLNMFNPLVNTQASWMPDRFHVGSPLSQIPEAELLLPGTGYEATHDVNMTFPAHAEMLGLTLEDTVRSMLGVHPQNTSKYSHSSVDLDRKNREVLAAGTVFDPYHNINGMHDGIIRSGRMRAVRKIKKLSEEELDSFVGPPNSDVSEMNWFLRMARVPAGIIQYQFNGQPVYTYPVKYSHSRYLRDVNTIRQAKYFARDLLAGGLGFSGESYSHIDRLDILSNVSPYSDQYHQEEQIVKLQMAAGYPIRDRYEKIKRKRQAIMTKEELYPYRFAGKVLTPDSRYNNLSLNENIKAADQYSLLERFIGSVWERASHLNTPIHGKFMHYRTPREAYERSTLYGRDIKLWSHPIDHFMEAYGRGFMSKTTPFQGSIAGVMAGSLIGGPGLGTLAGGAVGALYGGVHGTYRHLTGSTYIPGTIKEGRSINRYFDKVAYQKNMMLYSATGDERFLEEAKGTMSGLIPNDISRSSWSYMYRATPPQEKPHIIAFIREKDPDERTRILQLVPEEVGEVLKAKWARADKSYYNARLSDKTTQPLPAPDWAGWAPEIPLKDVQMKVIEEKGLDPHDFGLGWYDQVNRINESPWINRVAVDMNSSRNKNVSLAYNQNISEIRRTIEIALRGQNANITVSRGAQNIITIINI